MYMSTLGVVFIVRCEQENWLSTNKLLFQKSGRYVNDSSHDKSEFVGNVTAVRTDQFAQRSNIPSLDHAHDPSNNANSKRNSSRDSKRKTARVVPRVKVVVIETHASENDVFAE